MSYDLSKKAKSLAVDLGDILLFVLILSLIIHISAAMIAYLYPPMLQGFRVSIDGNVRLNIGLPAAAVGAYGVVSLLLHSFPPEKQTDGNTIKLKFLNLECTGPAGPVMLWVVCFLSIISALIWIPK